VVAGPELVGGVGPGKRLVGDRKVERVGARPPKPRTHHAQRHGHIVRRSRPAIAISRRPQPSASARILGATLRYDSEGVLQDYRARRQKPFGAAGITAPLLGDRLDPFVIQASARHRRHVARDPATTQDAHARRVGYAAGSFETNDRIREHPYLDELRFWP
jgi:hypothetical protein